MGDSGMGGFQILGGAPRCPRVPPEAPRAPQGGPRGPQGRPRGFQGFPEAPRGAQGPPGDTRGHYSREGGGKVGKDFLKNGFLAKTRVP